MRDEDTVVAEIVAWLRNRATEADKYNLGGDVVDIAIDTARQIAQNIEDREYREGTP